MKSMWRMLPVSALVLIILSLASTPAHGQQLASVSAESCDYGGELFAIEALDELTVKFTLCFPDPAFPQKAAFAAFSIHPSEYLQATGGTGDLLTKPIGTGPYRIERWDFGNELVLSRFDDYWGEPAREQTLIFRWNTEATSRLLELQAGTVDGIDNVGAGDFEIIENDPNLQLFERPGTNVFYLGINNTVPPFDNVLVRQAIAHAIDRERLVENFYPRGSIVARQFLPPVIFGYTRDVEPYHYNLEQARELLEQSGVELPIRTTLSYRDVVRTYLPQPSVIAQDIQAQLAEIGIETEIVVMESGAFLDAAAAGQLSLHLLGWSADFPDATNFLDFHFGAGAQPQFGEKFDAITEPLARAGRIAEPQERLEIYSEANTAIRDLVPMVPIAHGGSATAFRVDIAGGHASPLAAEYFAVMNDMDDDTLVWMQNAEPISLYCNDESDGETLRACEQINESLLAYEIGGTDVVPSLARSFEVNDDATEYIFHLRDGVRFHNGSAFDANDVVVSWQTLWDASSPLHVGRDGDFSYFSGFFLAFLNDDGGA